MARTLKLMLLTLSLFLDFPCISTAQALPDWTFSSFSNATLAARMDRGLHVEDAENLDSMVSSLTVLRSSAISEYGNRITDEHELKKKLPSLYWSSMSVDYQSLLKSRADATQRTKLLAFVAGDLAAKVKYIRASNSGAAFSGNFPTSVRVTVKTVDGTGASRSNLYVRANPEAYGISSSPLYVFNSATSPETTTFLPPGRALLWVEDAAKHLLQSEPISIGDGGKDTVSFTIVVP